MAWDIFSPRVPHECRVEGWGHEWGNEWGKDATQAKSEKISGIISFVFKEHDILFLKSALCNKTTNSTTNSTREAYLESESELRRYAANRLDKKAAAARAIAAFILVIGSDSDSKSHGPTLSTANVCDNLHCDTQMRVTM